MTITVRAIGSLKRYIDSPATISAATVGAAIEMLDLPRDVDVVTMVNDRLAHAHTELQDGDVLQLVPVISGGGYDQGLKINHLAHRPTLIFNH